jgi:hypothetical protein
MIDPITKTKKWITDVVIGCNFCPFAAREVKLDRVRYEITDTRDMAIALELLMNECRTLDENTGIETTLLIFTHGFTSFDDYLDLVSLAEQTLKHHRYEGVYQVAGFHPLYRFAGEEEDDAANYTNRSPYPMLHLLREESIEKALEKYPDPDSIPERNIEFARNKGEAYMKALRNACL